MINKSIIDTMTTYQALGILLAKHIAGQVSQLDLGEAVAYLMRRGDDFTDFQIARLQSGLDMPDVMPFAIDVVLKDRALNDAIKSLKELQP